MGIETSCDDTAIAVVGNHKIYSECIIRQDEYHRKVKGIDPKVAVALHEQNIDKAIDKAMRSSNLSYSDLTGIAVTRGPGMGMCLAVGLEKAKQLSQQHNIPLVAVNHMEGHALIARFFEDIPFPFLTLLVSGGHTMIVVCRGVGQYIELGKTGDDSVGEAFDKVARLLGLDWNGGGGKPLEEAARKGIPGRFAFTTPMINKKNCDFSFSGLKSAVKREYNQLKDVTEQDIADLSYHFQEAAINHLLDKLKKAFKWCSTNLPTLNKLVVSGGVASNEELRSKVSELAKKSNYTIFFPPTRFCTDNGVMIAWSGIENYNASRMVFSGQERDDLFYDPKWPLDPSGVNYFPNVRKKVNLNPVLACENEILEGRYNKLIFKEAIKTCFNSTQYAKAIEFCNVALLHDPDENYYNKMLKKLRSQVQTMTWNNA